MSTVSPPEPVPTHVDPGHLALDCSRTGGMRGNLHLRSTTAREDTRLAAEIATEATPNPEAPDLDALLEGLPSGPWTVQPSGPPSENFDCLWIEAPHATLISVPGPQTHPRQAALASAIAAIPDLVAEVRHLRAETCSAHAALAEVTAAARDQRGELAVWEARAATMLTTMQAAEAEIQRLLAFVDRLSGALVGVLYCEGPGRTAVAVEAQAVLEAARGRMAAGPGGAGAEGDCGRQAPNAHPPASASDDPTPRDGADLAGKTDDGIGSYRDRSVPWDGAVAATGASVTTDASELISQVLQAGSVTQRALADKIGVAQSTISNWTRRISFPNLRRWQQLLAVVRENPRTAHLAAPVMSMDALVAPYGAKAQMGARIVLKAYLEALEVKTPPGRGA